MKNKLDLNKKRKVKGVKTVIEFLPGCVKLAQTSTKNNNTVSMLVSQDSIGDSQEELISAIEKVIKTNHIKIQNLIFSLDRSLVTVRFIKLPSVSEAEITEMAQWQATKLLPYKVDEIVVSHQTIKIDNEGFSCVLLVIIPRNIIKKFINTCEALKAQPKAITISSEGLSNWYYNIQSGLLDDALALVDIDKYRAEFSILYQKKFIFSRSLSLMQIKEDSQIVEKIISDAKLSFDSYYKQEVAPEIKRIVLTGDKSRAVKLSSLFSNEFNLTVETFDHLNKINLEKCILSSKLPADISFASICGLVLSQELPTINLIPAEVKERSLYLEKKKELFKTAIIASFAIVIFLGMFGFNLYNKKQIIKQLDKQLEKINPTAQGIQNIKNKISLINAQLSNEISCIEVLREIYKITPTNIYLNTFIFQENKEVVLKGTAPSMSLAFNFVPILNESKFFDNVEVRYVTQRKIQTGEITDFEIICKLKKSKSN